MKLSKRFLKQSEVYKLFVTDQDNLDFSKEALEEMYLFESQGIGNCNVHDQHIEYLKTGKLINGYAVGKKFQNITVSMWMETLNPLKTQIYGWVNLLIELREDEFPHWWLNKIFKDFLESKKITDIREITNA